MEINFNLGSLKIVHAPLMEQFKKIQNNISGNLKLVRDEKKIATNYEAIDLLGKSQSTLKMIGLLGLVKVLSLVTDTLKEIKEVKFDTNKTVLLLESIDQIFSDVIIYIDNLLIGEYDQPIKFYKQYANLAGLLGKKVNIKDLFIPKLELKSEAPQSLKEELRVGVFTNEINKKNLLNILKDSLTNIQNSNEFLVNAISKENIFTVQDEKDEYQGHCKKVYETLNTIQNLKLSKAVYLVSALQKFLICTTSPQFNENIINFVQQEEKDAIVKILKSNEKLIANWLQEVKEMENSEKTSILKVDDEIASDILFFLVKVTRNNNNLYKMPVFEELNNIFDFDFYSNQLKLSEVTSTLEQKNPELVKSIDQYFLDVKEELTLLTSKQSSNEDFLNQHVNKFIGFNDKLTEAFNNAEISDLNIIFEKLHQILSDVKAKKVKFNEIVQKEISLSVVLLEYGVKSFTRAILSDKQKFSFLEQLKIQNTRLDLAAIGNIDKLNSTPLPNLDEKNKQSDARSATLSLFQELSKELEKGEKILDTYLRTNGENKDELLEVFKPLKTAKGIFLVVGKPLLSELVEEIRKTWDKIKVEGISVVSEEELKKSIALLSGISIFINAAKDDNVVESDEIYAKLVEKYGDNKLSNRIIEVNVPKVEAKVETVVSKVEPKVVTKTKVKNVLLEDKTADPDLTETYVMEAEDCFEQMKENFKTLEKGLGNKSAHADLKRHFHTLKGSGRMLGLNYLGEVGWIVEQTLNKVCDGEIEFSAEFFASIKLVTENFAKWIEELKQNSTVMVDVISMKTEFLKYNKNISTIDLPTPVEEVEVVEVKPVVEENKVEVVEAKPIVVETKVEVVEAKPTVKKDTITINGKEIPVVLFNMFNEESESHIQGLKEFVSNHREGVISEEFVRHAHTLSSISKTISLNSFAKLANKLEFIGNLSYEKKAKLNKFEFSIIKNIVNKLSFYKKTATGLNIDEIVFSEELSLLNELQDSILMDKQTNTSVGVGGVNLEAFKKQIVNELKIEFKANLESEMKKLTEIVKENSKSIKETQDLLSKDVKSGFEKIGDIKSTVQSLERNINNVEKAVSNLDTGGEVTVDTDSIVSNVTKDVATYIQKQTNEVQNVIKKVVEDNKANIDGIYNRIDKVESATRNLEKAQKDSEKNFEQVIKVVKDEFNELKELAKKSGKKFLGIF